MLHITGNTKFHILTYMYNYVHMNNFRTYYLHVLLRQKSLSNSLLNVNCRKNNYYMPIKVYLYTSLTRLNLIHTTQKFVTIFTTVYISSSLHPSPFSPPLPKRKKKVEHESTLRICRDGIRNEVGPTPYTVLLHHPYFFALFPTTHMWQSHVEIADYSVAYFESDCCAISPLKAELIPAL